MLSIKERRELEKVIHKLTDDLNMLVSIFNAVEVVSDVSISKKDIEQNERDIFANRLRGIRKSVGITQKQLGERTGMKASVIARYETGGAMPRQKAIDKLANALNVPIYALDIRKEYLK